MSELDTIASVATPQAEFPMPLIESFPAHRGAMRGKVGGCGRRVVGLLALSFL